MSDLPDRLDAAVAGHRAPEADTAPLLAALAYLEPLRRVPPRAPRAAQAGQQAFLAEAVSLRPALRPTGWRRITAFMGHRRALATALSVLIVLIVLLVSLGGTVYAAQASGPGDTLYPVKLFAEDVRLGFATGAQPRLDMLVEMCQARTAEMTALAERRQAIPAEVPVRLQAQLGAALQAAADLDDAALAPALERMRAMLQVQTQELVQARRRAPGDGGLQQAERVLARTQAMIALGLNDPAQFRRAVRSGEGAPGTTPWPPGGHAPSTPGAAPGTGPGAGPGPQEPQATPRGQRTPAAGGPPAAGAGSMTPAQSPGPQPSRGPQNPDNARAYDVLSTA